MMAAAPLAGHVPLFLLHLSFSAWTFLSCLGVLACVLARQSINGKQERRKLSSDPVPHSLPPHVSFGSLTCLLTAWERRVTPLETAPKPAFVPCLQRLPSLPWCSECL